MMKKPTSKRGSRRPSDEQSVEGFHCGTCGKWHQGLPRDYACSAPAYWDWLPEAERGDDSHLDSDLCVIKGADFFVRGLIEIPILDMKEVFRWGVWVSLSRKNFQRMVELWNDPKLLQEPAYFGWLANRLPGYPDTLNLKTNVRSRKIEQRPFIELEPADHPLAVEQRNGITRARLLEIAQTVMHNDR